MDSYTSPIDCDLMLQLMGQNRFAGEFEECRNLDGDVVGEVYSGERGMLNPMLMRLDMEGGESLIKMTVRFEVNQDCQTPLPEEINDMLRRHASELGGLVIIDTYQYDSTPDGHYFVELELKAYPDVNRQPRERKPLPAFRQPAPPKPTLRDNPTRRRRSIDFD